MPVGDLAVREAVDAAVEADVLADGQVVVEREPLAHVADAALDLLGLRRHVEPGGARLAGGGREEPRQHLHRRRLTRAVRAEEAEHLASGDLERDGVDGREVAEGAREVARPDGGGIGSAFRVQSS